ncbi:biotin/lipoyl-containing protein [Azotosporobacter soli]|uniref:biotin/lipoyl-containing protein n=1 Tax=Azotosporobacter soli TaxID=3055040 RepID=UPI0031FEFB87
MSSFELNITLNGVTYNVEVEKVNKNSAAQPKAAVVAAPAAQPIAAPVAAAKPASAPAAVAAGDTSLNAPLPGKVIRIVAKAGSAVKKGDVVMILEAMKMQNEIASPVDGTVKSIQVSDGQNVKPGEQLAIIG